MKAAWKLTRLYVRRHWSQQLAFSVAICLFSTIILVTLFLCQCFSATNTQLSYEYYGSFGGQTLFCCFFCKCTSPLSLCAALRLSDWLLRITFYLNNYMVGLVNPIFVIFYCFAKNEFVYTMTLSNRSPNRLKISLGIVPAHSATWAAVISKSPFFPITIALSPGDT